MSTILKIFRCEQSLFSCASLKVDNIESVFQEIVSQVEFPVEHILAFAFSFTYSLQFIVDWYLSLRTMDI